MFEDYEQHRVKDVNLVGEAIVDVVEDKNAFLAGVQWTLDGMLQPDHFAANHGNFGPCWSEMLCESVAIHLLEKAKAYRE